MTNPELPGRSIARISSTSAGFAGAALAAITLLALLALSWFEYAKVISSDRDRLDMQARVLADHATRSVESASLFLSYMADQISGDNLLRGQHKLDPMLSQGLAALPYVRSLYLLDSSGTVQNSTHTPDIAARISLAHLGAMPAPGQERLGDFLHGRSLGALQTGGDKAATSSGFFPLIRSLKIDGQNCYLVALINPDSFASFQLLTMNNAKTSAYLTSYQGVLLASSGPNQMALGTNLVGHPVFSQYLPAVEHASYVGGGVMPHDQVVAFRLSRTRPVVVIVEQAYVDTLWRWAVNIRWFALAATLTIVFLLAMTVAVQRSLRAREAAQGALQHQLGFVAQLLEVSPLPIATYDIEGRYITVNRAWEDFMGLARKDIIGKRNEDLMPGAQAELHARQNAMLLASGGTLRYEADMQHRDGSRRDMVVTKVLVPGDHRHPAMIVSTTFDVSEFRSAARATQQARDAAEESSRAKSEFIANISHELRTPLQSILGFSELGTMRSKESPKLHSMFNDIHTSGNRMLGLVNDLLDVSRIDSDMGIVTLERADARGLVQSVLQDLRPQLSNRNIQLNIALGTLPLMAKVDPLRFGQVIRNVTANAIKYSPAGASIDIAGTLLTNEVSAAAEVCISIRDHGVGIPPMELEHIFEAFVQSSQTKDGSGGTGLGLAVCRRILRAHHGRIVAENMPDGGSVFRIYLPAHRYLEQETDFSNLQDLK